MYKYYYRPIHELHLSSGIHSMAYCAPPSSCVLRSEFFS